MVIISTDMARCGFTKSAREIEREQDLDREEAEYIEKEEIRLGVKTYSSYFGAKTYDMVFVTDPAGKRRIAMGIVVNPPTFFQQRKDFVYLVYPSHKGCYTTGPIHESVNGNMLRKFDYQMSHLHDGERREFMRQPSAQINLELAEEYMKLELQERAHDMKRVTMDFLGVST